MRRDRYMDEWTRWRWSSRPRGSDSTRGSYTHTPPTSRACSKTTTAWPSALSSRAAARPAAPAPTTATRATRRAGGAEEGSAMLRIGLGRARESREGEDAASARTRDERANVEVTSRAGATGPPPSNMTRAGGAVATGAPLDATLEEQTDEV